MPDPTPNHSGRRLADALTRGKRSVRIMTSLCAGVLLLRCDGCQSAPIATLTQAQGEVSRDYAARVGRWETAAVGSELRLGDGIQLQGEGVAVLDLGGDSTLSMQPDTVLRLLLSGNRGPFAIESGEAVLQVGPEAYPLQSELGLAVLSPNSQARLLRQGSRVLYRLNVGFAYFEQNGQRFRAEVGDAIVVGGSALELEPADNPQPGDAVEAAVSATEAGTPVALGLELWLPADGVLSRAPRQSDFVSLARGQHPLASGSVLRLNGDQSARASRGGDRVSLQGRGDFTLEANPGVAMVRAHSGFIDVETTQWAVEIEVPDGTILVEALPGGGRARITAGERMTTIQVERGQVVIKDASGVRALYGGEEGTLGVAAEPTRRQESSGIRPGPERCDVPLERRRLLTLHAATVPVVVGLPVPNCDGPSAVKIRKTATRGEGAVHVALGPGRHPYTAHCLREGKLGKTDYRGVVQVLHDSGTRELPKKAPDTKVDIDGRLYTILYQNQPPQVTVHWPQAATATSYKLKVERAGKSAVFSTATPTYTFPSGALRDGEHAATFTSAAGARSKTTTIDLGFDNAAPKASLFLPRQYGFQAGDRVQVEGVVLPGWKVALEGGTIHVDRQHRFHGEVTTSVENPHVVLRLSHPKGGVHYYVRNAAP